MSIGTSLGAFFDTDAHFQAGLHQGIMEPKETNDPMEKTPIEVGAQKSVDEVILDPKNGIGLPISFKQPLGGSTEPAGALKSSGGTETPDNTANTRNADNIDAIRAPFGTQSAGEIPEGDLQGQVFSKKIKDILKSAYSAFTAAGDAMKGRFDPNSEEGVQRALEMAGWMVGAPAPVASKLADGTLGSFAGVKAKTADLGTLQAVKDAAKAGVHPDEIFEKTGWFQGADGNWKFEIPDVNAKLNEKGWDKTITQYKNLEDQLTVSLRPPKKDFFGKNKPETVTKLPDVLDHPELYEAYPFLKNTNIGPFPFETKSIGQTDFASNQIYLKNDLDPAFARSVLLHEIQHFIQRHEGFSRGGMASEFTKQGEDKALELYKRLQGEVEARNVQTRMDMSPEELSQKPPVTTEDRPRFVQIPAQVGSAPQMRNLPELRSGGGGRQYNMLTDWLWGKDDKTKVTEDKAPPLSSYPSQKDAEEAIKNGFGYGTGLEPYINAEVARINTSKKVPEDLDQAFTLPSKNIDMTKFSNLDVRRKVGTVFTQAALAANKSAIASLGFDPGKIVLQTDIPKTTIAGAYDPPTDSIWMNNTYKDTGVAVHESIHRGLKLLRDNSDEAKAIMKRLPEEHLVRYLMANTMGDPEKGAGEAADQQRKSGIEMFGGKDILSKKNREDLAKLEDIAAQLYSQKRGRGPK